MPGIILKYLFSLFKGGKNKHEYPGGVFICQGFKNLKTLSDLFKYGI